MEHGGRKRWIIVNFGEETSLEGAPFATATALVNSDDARWGGAGWPVAVDKQLTLPPHTAAFLAQD
jgi:hypothetical protein